MRYAVIGTIICICLAVYLSATRTVDQAGPGQVEIRFSFPADVRSMSAYARITRRFMELNPDIHVTLQPASGDFRQGTLRDLAGNIAADVIWTSAEDLCVFVEGRHFLDLDPYIEQDHLDLDAYYRPAIESFRADEKQYGLPAWWGCSLVLYNKDMLAEAGVTADPLTWTWDEFLDACKKCTQMRMRNGRMVQCYGYVRDNQAHTMCHIWQSGGTILQRVLTCPHCGAKNEVEDIVRAADAACTKCGKSLAGAKESWIGKIDTPEAIRGVKFATELIQYAPRQAANNGSEQATNRELFAEGRLAMMRGGPWSASQLKDTNVNWDIGYYPAGPGGRKTRFYTDGFGIWSRSQHPREAWRLLKFVCGQQAERVYANEGSSIPSLKAVAESPAFNRPDTPWDEMKFVRAIDHARFMRKTKEWDEVSLEMGRFLDLVMMPADSDRRITPEQFCRRMQGEIEEILAKRAARNGGGDNVRE